MAPSTILFLAANPVELQPLQLGEECRVIENMIRAAKFRDRIRFCSRWAARPDDLLQALNEENPSILHFSGHGAGHRGLCFQSEDGSVLRVSAEVLQQVIRAAGGGIRIVILNACFSEVQARDLATHVPCVIGMSDAIGDKAAITYAGSFYRALAFGKSVANAHEQGLAAIALPSTGGRARDVRPDGRAACLQIPTLLTRPGTDADRIHIVDLTVAKRLCEIRIRATLREFDEDVIARVTKELRNITGDLSLEILDVEEGSIRLTVSLSTAAMKKLLQLKAGGRLDEICGLAVYDIVELHEAQAKTDKPALASLGDEPKRHGDVMAARAVASMDPASASSRDEHQVREALLAALLGGPARRRSEDEVTLALLVKEDRRGAVTSMMAAHEERVFGYCVGMLRDRELAEDVAQEVFTEAYRKIARFRGESSLRTWLMGIAHHRCGDAIKARTRRSSRIELDSEAVEDHVDPGVESSEKLDRARLIAALEGCLGELSPEIRETVLLRLFSGMTYEEMAPMLGRKADTLCVRVARALPILRRCLERKGWKSR